MGSRQGLGLLGEVQMGRGSISWTHSFEATTLLILIFLWKPRQDVVAGSGMTTLPLFDLKDP